MVRMRSLNILARATRCIEPLPVMSRQYDQSVFLGICSLFGRRPRPQIASCQSHQVLSYRKVAETVMLILNSCPAQMLKWWKTPHDPITPAEWWAALVKSSWEDRGLSFFSQEKDILKDHPSRCRNVRIVSWWPIMLLFLLSSLHSLVVTSMLIDTFTVGGKQERSDT